MKEFLVISFFIIASQTILTKGCPPPPYELSIGNQCLPSAALLSALGGCGCGCGCSNYDLPISNPCLQPSAGIPARIGCSGSSIYELLGNQCSPSLSAGPTVVSGNIGCRGPIAYEVPIGNQCLLQPAPVVAPCDYRGSIAYEVPIGNQCLLPPAPVIAPCGGCPAPVAYGLPIGNPYLPAPSLTATLPPPPCPCSRCHFLRKIPIPPPCI